MHGSGDLTKEEHDHARIIQAILPYKKLFNCILCHTTVKHIPDIGTALKSDSVA